MPVRNVTRLPLWQRVLLFVLVGTGVAGFLPATGSDHGFPTLALLSVHAAQSVNEAFGGRSEPARSDIAATIPLAARDTLKALEQRHGQPLPGYVGGRSFLNRERALPRGRYREYDVHPKVPGKTRGAQRIVIDQGTGKAYYTADHYRSFVPMN